MATIEEFCAGMDSMSDDAFNSARQTLGLASGLPDKPREFFKQRFASLPLHKREEWCTTFGIPTEADKHIQATVQTAAAAARSADIAERALEFSRTSAQASRESAEAARQLATSAQEAVLGMKAALDGKHRAERFARIATLGAVISWIALIVKFGLDVLAFYRDLKK